MFFRFFNFNAGTIYSTNALWKSMIPKKRWTEILNFGLAFWKFNQLRSDVLDNCTWNIFYHICHRRPRYTKGVACFSITPFIAYILYLKTLSYILKFDFHKDSLTLFFSNCIHHVKVRHCFTQQFLAFFQTYFSFSLSNAKLFLCSSEVANVSGIYLIIVCGFKFYRIHQNLTSIWITFKISSAYSKIWHIFVWSNKFEQILKKEDVLYSIKLIWWKKSRCVKKKKWK